MWNKQKEKTVISNKWINAKYNQRYMKSFIKENKFAIKYNSDEQNELVVFSKELLFVWCIILEN